MSPRRNLVAALVLLAAVFGPTVARAKPLLQFGLFGDTPYSDYERAQLPLLLADMGSYDLAFAIHDGDIKNGQSRCDDGLYQDILGAFQQAPLALVYVPGDNEWTDCQRLSAGRFVQGERLAYLRKVFFYDQRSLGRQPIALERQTDFPENVRWVAGPVQFVTLNMPGYDNNVSHGEEYGPRNKANLAWLQEAFRLAKAQQRKGLVLAIQANPFIEADNEGATKPGFKDFLDQLRTETAAFSGQVLLVHGDTHSMQINQPLRERRTRKLITNFTRVETYGAPFLGWIKAVVDDEEPRLFRFETHPWPLRSLGQ